MSSNGICASCQQKIGSSLLRAGNTVTKKICPVCQFSYCSNCLYQKIAVPKLNYVMHEVCSKCYHQIQHELLQPPPKNFIKRIEKLPSTDQFYNPPPNKTNDLEQRLKQLRMESNEQQLTDDQRLKQSRIELNEQQSTDDQLQQRLQALRGDQSSSSSTRNTLPKGKMSTNPDDLMAQMNAELTLDQKNKQTEDEHDQQLQERIRALGIDRATLPSTKPLFPEEQIDEEEDELPWCTVCNDNATKRCNDCEELFCDKCAKKTHSEKYYKSHHLEPYKPSAKAKKKYY
ncbi:unnamed protein product [Didymodactylos carnosus]|uniref:FYVE-type domain-containing protein n=1 Tax=Didymodactylos carnosus TaxID=1234261 RepID=A0A813RTY3_9BILA|nr:unnamed protein product [Didymodactylos carnosus]CAF1072966.1 unnamed protein product [Didymodactylos carnosus]CAF3568758.1 unnamed protein product [Didymodactylos carnosus]CAF3837031.1 unnamed protein product [Didymodactylos carnosus]